MNVIHKIFRKLISKYTFIKIKLFNSKVSLGKNVNFRKRFEINCVENSKVFIGNNVFFNNGCSINAHKYISIGNDCIFGEDVKIYDHNHRFNNINVKIQNQGFACKDIKIGENCWIGSNVVILAGTRIGNNAIIGAGTIVHGEIPSDSIVTQERKCVIKQIKYIE